MLQLKTRYLDGSNLRMWWYQLIWYIKNREVPLRYSAFVDALSLGLGLEGARTIGLGLFEFTGCQ
jgi:hypothetical protein